MVVLLSYIWETEVSTSTECWSLTQSFKMLAVYLALHGVAALICVVGFIGFMVKCRGQKHKVHVNSQYMIFVYSIWSVMMLFYFLSFLSALLENLHTAHSDLYRDANLFARFMAILLFYASFMLSAMRHFQPSLYSLCLLIVLCSVITFCVYPHWITTISLLVSATLLSLYNGLVLMSLISKKRRHSISSLSLRRKLLSIEMEPTPTPIAIATEQTSPSHEALALGDDPESDSLSTSRAFGMGTLREQHTESFSMESRDIEQRVEPMTWTKCKASSFRFKMSISFCPQNFGAFV